MSVRSGMPLRLTRTSDTVEPSSLVRLRMPDSTRTHLIFGSGMFIIAGALQPRVHGKRAGESVSHSVLDSGTSFH